MPTHHETVLITGPTSGIGYELARCFARDGYSLALASRDAARLSEVAAELERDFGVRAACYPADLSEPGAPEELFRRLSSDQAPVHILVNNAGYTVFGLFADNSMADEMSMITTNVTALTALSKLYLQQVPSSGRRGILQLASTAAFQGGPRMAVYYATKAYVLSFSEALAAELADQGITVTALCPGITATNFARRGRMERSRLVSHPALLSDAQTVAAVGYRAFQAGKRIEVVGLLNRLLVLGTRLLPRHAVVRIVQAIQAPVRGQAGP